MSGGLGATVRALMLGTLANRGYMQPAADDAAEEELQTDRYRVQAHVGERKAA